jgi:hypothetical protein
MMGGDVTVTSEVGKGSVFTVRLSTVASASPPGSIDAIAYRTTDDGYRSASAACGDRPRRGAVARRTTDDGRGSGSAVRAERRLSPVIAGCTRRLDLGGGSSAGVDRHHVEKASEEGGAEDPSI